MRLRPDFGILLLMLLLATRVAAQDAPAAVPGIDDVQQAADVVRADPNLGAERKARTLRWGKDEQPTSAQARPGWISWVADLLGWIGQSARLLVWVACALLVGMVVVFLLRLLRDREARLGAAPAAPTHVRDLDIRPESLPDDIGAAARQLWDAGDARRALALLYRGLLSRLAHTYQAPVRDSTTEGDTEDLARRFLSQPGGQFAAGLVHTWSHAVYGGRMPDTPNVHALCAGFAPALDPPVEHTGERA